MLELRKKDKDRLKSKEWRVSHLYKIKNKQKELVTFKPNPAQDHFEKNRHTRNIILKSRQLGFTTYESVDTLDDCLFQKNYDGLFIAHTLEDAKDIFDNKIYLAWENWPLKLALDISADQESARKLKIDFGDKSFSSISVSTSGRSGTFSRLHITEFAKLCKTFPDRAKEVIDGSIPAVPTHGRVDIESTAESSEGLFHDMFWAAWDRGEPQFPTQFKAHFYNWQWDPEVKQTKPIPNLPKDFIEYQQKHNLTDQEISYYYLKYISLGEHDRNWATMKKEYPTTPEEAFEGSGNKLFDLEKLGLQPKKDPISEYNNFKIYAHYKLGHVYGMGCDVAEGIGRDSSTIALWDFTPRIPEIVAEYKNNLIAPDMFAHEIKNLAEKYNYPLVAVERNNHGHTTISKLREIYPERHIFAYDGKEKYGWLTNGVTKPLMFYALNTAVNEELISLNSSAIISEARRYDKENLRTVRHNEAGEETTNHFDLLTAAVIGFQMKDYAPAIRRAKPKTSTGSSIKRGSGIKGV